jgi:cytochrome c nitrite reductase small subunit
MAKEYKWLWSMFALAGLVAGLGGYTFYVSRAWSYLSDEPAVCLNCHLMDSQYKSWERSSHAVWATCNDCHVPQDRLLRKYAFKARDGLYHAAVFTVRGEPRVIRARQGSDEVIMENCVRCHTPLVTEFTKMDAGRAIAGESKACWDCHTQVPHTSISNWASSKTSHAVPFPDSPVPGWLDNMLK